MINIKNQKKIIRMLSVFLLVPLILVSSTGCKEWDSLSVKERQTLDGILAHWETWVPAKKKDGSAPLLTFKDLYQGLSAEQTAFLDAVRAIRPSPLDFDPSIALQKIENQPVTRQDGTPYPMGIQYLPVKVYEASEVMMAAMKKDLGKRLWVESGYRSPAYQLYTFLYYTPKHHYSLKQTNRWVALPGHSEHGDPSRQAIDYINEQGINGDSDNHQTAADFEALEEFQWLQAHAGEYGFVLSYPRGHKTTNYEPWHWRYQRG